MFQSTSPTLEKQLRGRTIARNFQLSQDRIFRLIHSPLLLFLIISGVCAFPCLPCFRPQQLLLMAPRPSLRRMSLQGSRYIARSAPHVKCHLPAFHRAKKGIIECLGIWWTLQIAPCDISLLEFLCNSGSFSLITVESHKILKMKNKTIYQS